MNSIRGRILGIPSLRLWFVVAATGASIIFGQANPPSGSHRVTYKVINERKERVEWGGILNQPLWSNGALVGVLANMSDAPVLFRVDRDGTREEIALAIQGAHFVGVTGLAGGTDGSIVAGASAYADDGRRTSFVVRAFPKQNRLDVTQLFPYRPAALAVAPDNSIFLIGWIEEGEASHKVNLLRHFDPGGKFLTEHQLRGKANSGMEAAMWSILTAGADRLRWLTNGGEYQEILPDGTVALSLNAPPGVVPMTLAASATGEVILGAVTYGDNWKGAWRLNRAKRSWEPIELRGQTRAILGGFDGSDLILVLTDGTVRRLAAEQEGQQQ